MQHHWLQLGIYSGMTNKAASISVMFAVIWNMLWSVKNTDRVCSRHQWRGRIPLCTSSVLICCICMCKTPKLFVGLLLLYMKCHLLFSQVGRWTAGNLMIVCRVIHVPAIKKLFSIHQSNVSIHNINCLFPHNLGQAFLTIPHTCNTIDHKQGKIPKIQTHQ